ncbi:unnamed protein product, partial [Iphiclides podalirius]
MELQALLVLCGLGVAGVAVILLMGLFSASGTTYEEAIAQQRKATTELLALADNKGKAKKTSKKANKKLAKKEKKENATSATGSEPESEAPAESGVDEDSTPALKPHVEFSPPVVVDVPTDTPPNIKALEKREDATEKRDKAAKPAKNAKAAIKPTATPEPVKEEVLQERPSAGDAPKEQRKVKKAEKRGGGDEAAAAEEPVQPLNSPQPSELTTDKLLKQALAPAAAAPAPSPPGGKGRKKKPEPNVLSLMAGDSGGVAVSELVRVVREAALSRTEIQILTEALLNKHHDPLPEHSEWTEGPNDPMQKMKKQLAEKEKALADEVEASQALHAKLKELRATLNAERGRAAAASRAAEQAAGAARAELHTLQARLQRVLDDNHALAQDKLHLQSKLGAEGEAQAQRVQMEMHIQRLSESEAALLQQLTALQAEMNTLARETAQARCDAAAARDSMMMAQRHAEELAQQLQEANRVYAELEQQRQRAVHAEKLAQQELRELQERLAGITELQNEVQRLTTRAQTAESNVDKLREEAEKAKGDANKLRTDTEKLKQEVEKIREESEQQKSQSSNALAALKEQLISRETELAELKQMAAVPAQNGLPPSANDDQKRASELAKVESVVEALRGELAAALIGSSEQKEQIATLRDQLHHYQEKNNELRTKNWKVMEALQSAEKALQAKSTSALPAQDSLPEAIARARESQYVEVAGVLRSACPAVAPSSGAGRAWLEAFADNLRSEFAKMEAQKHALERKQRELEEARLVQAAPSVADPRLSELAAQNEQLQSLLDKYKRVIDDTEGALSRLQQNVAVEEQRWAKQLAEKQRELDELQQRTVSQMQKRIDTLEVELQKAQTTNHSNSFADAERLTEEKLMGSLTEKHDLRNGPLQVTLEEK